MRQTESVYPEVMNEFRRESLDLAIGPIPERGLGRDYKSSKFLDGELGVAVRQGHHKASAKSIREFLEEDWLVSSGCDSAQ